MKNNDALKKHHFWILFGLVPLCVLIAVFMINSGVGGKIDERAGAIDKASTEIKGKTNPKPNKLLELMDESIKKVDGKRGGLHKENWDRQKPLYVWPTSEHFRNFSVKPRGTDGKAQKGDDNKDKVLTNVSLEDLKFGDELLDTNNQFAEFRKPEFYRALYSIVGIDKAKLSQPDAVGIADSIAPTQFLGGWERILRHVSAINSNDKDLTSDQIWLLMEDYWVQKSLLEAIRSVNEQMSDFRRIKYETKDVNGATRVVDDPDNSSAPQELLKRKFRSRIWDVSLEVVTRGNKKYMIGTLENITDRLQILGIGKTLTLKVWLEGKHDENGKLKMGSDGKPDVEGIEPFEFRIGSEFLPGKGGPKRMIKDKDGKEREIPSNIVAIMPDEANDKDLDRYLNLIPPGKTVAEIVRVEQEFDTQTVPVRRIDALALGFPDSRYAALGALYAPKFIPPEALAAPAPTQGGMGMGSGGPPPMSGTGGDPSSRDGGMGGTGALGGRFGGGPVATVVDANRRRYVAVTDQVRRMPVGIVVIVDQSYIQDMLLAFANSPLRFQITQVTWKRFRDSLGSGSTGSGGLSSPDSPLFNNQGQFGTGFGTGGTADPDLRGSGPRLPGSGGPPAPFGGGPPMPFGAQPPMIGGSGASGYNPYDSGDASSGGGFGSLTTVSEAQLTSGLVELSVYGVVSLYERYTPPAEPSTTEVKEKDKGDEKEKEKKKDEEKDKKPMEPMTGTTEKPKMRVRRRV